MLESLEFNPDSISASGFTPLRDQDIEGKPNHRIFAVRSIENPGTEGQSPLTVVCFITKDSDNKSYLEVHFDRLSKRDKELIATGQVLTAGIEFPEYLEIIQTLRSNFKRIELFIEENIDFLIKHHILRFRAGSNIPFVVKKLFSAFPQNVRIVSPAVGTHYAVREVLFDFSNKNRTEILELTKALFSQLDQQIMNLTERFQNHFE